MLQTNEQMPGHSVVCGIERPKIIRQTQALSMPGGAVIWMVYENVDLCRQTINTDLIYQIPEYLEVPE